MIDQAELARIEALESWGEDEIRVLVANKDHVKPETLVKLGLSTDEGVDKVEDTKKKK